LARGARNSSGAVQQIIGGTERVQRSGDSRGLPWDKVEGARRRRALDRICAVIQEKVLRSSKTPAFDVKPDGTVANTRDFAPLRAEAGPSGADGTPARVARRPGAPAGTLGLAGASVVSAILGPRTADRLAGRREFVLTREHRQLAERPFRLHSRWLATFV
jgi:hypothetical protein